MGKHITILALGSQGDVLPYITLGGALCEAGHRVRLATFENFQKVVTSNGLDFHPIQGDAQALMRSVPGMDLASAGKNVIRTARAIMKTFGPTAREYAADLSGLAHLKTDGIINQLPGGLFGYDLAEKLGVPHILASVIPLARTSTRPMLVFPEFLAPVPGYNGFTHRLAEQIVWGAFRSTINHWREETLNLPRLPILGYFSAMEDNKTPILNGFSAEIVPRPADWEDHIHITGYWFPHKQDGWRPDEELVRFIGTGPPPVYIGFGSMPIREPARLVQTILKATEMSDVRLVLGHGWGGFEQVDLPENVIAIDYAPYEWLFPQMTAVVHHGGSGTTAYGLRAGVPEMIVPFLFDQFYWGRRLAEMGVGLKPLPFKQLSPKRLAAGLVKLTEDHTMHKVATTLGEKISQEDGLGRAVEIVGKILE